MLAKFVAPPFLLLYYVVGSVVFVHFRGRDRLGFLRQLTDHSTLMAPYNVLMYLFSAVPNRPFIDVSAVPELRSLRDNWEIIRDEAQGLYREGNIKAADAYNDWGFNSFFRMGWKRFYLKWYDEPLPSAVSACPRTVELLRAIPSIKGAMFANLEPGGRLVRHRDPFAGSLRYHLGLVVPKSPGECRIFIDGEPYSWRDGEDILFDETYLHYAENTTSENRLILFCDIERPLHTRAMRAFNRWFSNNLVRESATQNVAGERVGVINKAFAYVYPLRLLGKRMKAWNRNVYYTAKYTAVAALIGGLLWSMMA